MAQVKKKLVYVGLSGGVDSALSAAILKDKGYDVVGVFIETWHPNFLPCTWKDDRREAMRAAAYLDIPFISLDLSEKYRVEVGEYFIEEYAKGRTPNPDVMCNRSIKFGGFADFARTRGADFVATGHYAGIVQKDGRHYITASPDVKKDQSYFLWMLTEDDIAFALFPLQGMTKEEVRREAKRRGLPQATRKDSQGICFLGAVDLPEFLSKFIPLSEGVVLDEKGTKVGTHKGAALYTVGERHGFSVSDTALRKDPLYVLSTNIKENTITVGTLLRVPVYTSIQLSSTNLRGGLEGMKLEALVRYHGARSRCTVTDVGQVYTVNFEEPVSVAPGQSVVLYNGNLIVGGGVVKALT